VVSASFSLQSPDDYFHFAAPERPLKCSLDDSKSMQTRQRIPVLKDTLRRVARFATYLKPTGISLRFLNHHTDRTFDDLTSAEKVMNRVENIEFSGSTRLGTELDEQVVKPLIKRAERREFRRPLFVVIITDGEVTKSSRSS
jgi:Mg-chelatase subunit ChlD